MSKYRIPKREEFIEGFKFEVYMKSGGHSFAILDLYVDNDLNFEEEVAVNKTAIIEDWTEYVVPKIDLSIEWCFNFSLFDYLAEKKIRTLKLL